MLCFQDPETAPTTSIGEQNNQNVIDRVSSPSERQEQAKETILAANEPEHREW